MKNPPRFGGILIFLILTSLCIPALAAKDDLSFSLESGFYAQPQQLEISAEAEDAVIYYTLDGSAPGENSLRYEGPIFLSDTTKKPDPLSQKGGVNPEEYFKPRKNSPSAHPVRARALLPNGKWTEEICGTYFIGFDRQQLYGDLPIISLMTDADGLFNYETGIYVLGKVYDEWIAQRTEPYAAWEAAANYTQRGKEWERETMVDFLLGNEDDFSQLMGLRIKGGASRAGSQKSLRLIAREEYGEKNVLYPLFPGNLREFDGVLLHKYKSFTLRTGANDRDHSRIRDPFIQNLAEGLCLETSANRPVIAFINGEYWGIYTLHEEYSDNFFQYHYGIDNENIVTFKTNTIDDGTEEDANLYWQMLNYIADHDMEKDADYQAVCNMIDMQSFADYMALQLYIFNEDGIFQNNNWEMWRVRDPNLDDHPYADGKWRMMVYDTDYSSGVYVEGNNYAQNNILEMLQKEYEPWHPASMLPNFLKDESFRQIFITSLCDVRNIFFDQDRALTLQTQMHEEYAPYLEDTYLRFGPNWIMWNPKKNLENNNSYLTNFITGRYNAFPKLIKNAFGLESAKAITIRIKDADKGTVLINNRPVPVKDGQRLHYFADYPITVTAVPHEGAEFKGWRLSNKQASLEDASALETTLHFTGSVTLTAQFK